MPPAPGRGPRCPRGTTTSRSARLDVGERTGGAGQAGTAQGDVLVEREAQLEEQARAQHARRHGAVADRPQQDGVVLGQPARTDPGGPPGAQDRRRRIEVVVVPAAPSRTFSLSHDLGADSVTGDHRDPRHVAPPLSSLESKALSEPSYAAPAMWTTRSRGLLQRWYAVGRPAPSRSVIPRPLGRNGTGALHAPDPQEVEPFHGTDVDVLAPGDEAGDAEVVVGQFAERGERLPPVAGPASRCDGAETEQPPSPTRAWIECQYQAVVGPDADRRAGSSDRLGTDRGRAAGPPSMPVSVSTPTSAGPLSVKSWPTGPVRRAGPATGAGVRSRRCAPAAQPDSTLPEPDQRSVGEIYCGGCGGPDRVGRLVSRSAWTGLSTVSVMRASPRASCRRRCIVAMFTPASTEERADGCR